MVSDQAIAEALVSTMLLEDSSPRQALADFLLARKASIHQLLNRPPHGILPFLKVCRHAVSLLCDVHLKPTVTYKEMSLSLEHV